MDEYKMGRIGAVIGIVTPLFSTSEFHGLMRLLESLGPEDDIRTIVTLALPTFNDRTHAAWH